MIATDKRAALAKWAGERVLEAAAIAGAGLITYGVWLMHRPAAFIVAGLFLLGGAWLLAGKDAA
jgi:hypothetical protein